MAAIDSSRRRTRISLFGPNARMLGSAALIFALAGFVGCDKPTTSAITIEGTLEHLVAIDKVIAFQEVTAIPPEGSAQDEFVLQGALLQLRSGSGQVYVVRVQPQCRSWGDFGDQEREESPAWTIGGSRAMDRRSACVYHHGNTRRA